MSVKDTLSDLLAAVIEREDPPQSPRIFFTIVALDGSTRALGDDAPEPGERTISIQFVDPPVPAVPAVPAEPAEPVPAAEGPPTQPLPGGPEKPVRAGRKAFKRLPESGAGPSPWGEDHGDYTFRPILIK